MTKALLTHLHEMDQLVLAARKGMQSDEFISGLHEAMQNIQKVLCGTTNHEYLDADYILTETIEACDSHPSLSDVKTIGNAVVRYRTAATFASTELE